MSLPVELQNLFNGDCECQTATMHPTIPNIAYRTEDLTIRFWDQPIVHPLEIVDRSGRGSHAIFMDFALQAAKRLSVIIGKLADDIDDAYEIAHKLDLLSTMSSSEWRW